MTDNKTLAAEIRHRLATLDTAATTPLQAKTLALALRDLIRNYDQQLMALWALLHLVQPIYAPEASPHDERDINGALLTRGDTIHITATRSDGVEITLGGLVSRVRSLACSSSPRRPATLAIDMFDPALRVTTPHDAHIEPAVNSEPGSPEQDRAARLVPDRRAVAQAGRMLSTSVCADMVYIPMYLPGATRGQWEVGQRVVTVPGVFVLATDDHTPIGSLPRSLQARAVTWAIARDRLREDCGGDGVAVAARVVADGHVSVCEDVL